MSGGGGVLANGGGLEALLKAAKFVEEQEKQKLRRQSAVHRASEDGEGKELTVVVANGLHGSAPTPPLPRHGSVIREVHNKLEKNRRAHLKECFETLKKQLPPSPEEKKTSNLSILHNAIRYIAILKRKEREFEHEMERLAREKIGAQQRLATLKKELTAQWEHIDLATLLPDVVEADPPRRASDMVNSCNLAGADTGSEEEEAEAEAVRTLYSSTSSLSSASPLPLPFPLHSDSSHHTQVAVVPLPLPLPLHQLLPSTTTIRMLPVPTSGITIKNGLINHNTVTLASKHTVGADGSGGLAHHPAPHLLLASPNTGHSHKVALQPQLLVKPPAEVVSAMVVVTASSPSPSPSPTHNHN